MKRKLIKTNTVLIRRPRLTGIYGQNEIMVPLICFSGTFLKGYGFEVGKRYDVYAQKNQIVLRAKGFKYKNPIIKGEGQKNELVKDSSLSHECLAELNASGE